MKRSTYYQKISLSIALVLSQTALLQAQTSTCGSFSKPCVVSNLLVVSGSNVSIATTDYPLDQSTVLWTVPPNVPYTNINATTISLTKSTDVEVLMKSGGLFYTQKTFARISPNGVADEALLLKNSQMYPNPAHDQMHIDFANAFAYQIETTDGTVLLTGKAQDHATVSLQELKSGVYHLVLQSGNERAVKRLVVE